MPHSNQRPETFTYVGYPIVHENNPHVRITIVWANKESEDVVLVESAAGGLKFYLKERSLTCLKKDQELTLKIKVASSVPAYKVAAVVWSIEETEARLGYTCYFSDSFNSDKKSPLFWQLFNRREAFRVHPPSGKTCPAVTLCVGADVITHDLADIGASGLAMVVPHAAKFTIGETAIVSLRLIQTHEEFSLCVKIRHRSFVRGKVIIGLEVDPTTDVEILQEIMFYVTMRQIVVMSDSKEP